VLTSTDSAATQRAPTGPSLNQSSSRRFTSSTAHAVNAIIRFNFVGTLVVDAVGVGMAAFSLLNPLIAAFIHVASELTFILNSARLLPGVATTSRRPEAQRAPTTVAPAA
jgi:hypothetical protein